MENKTSSAATVLIIESNDSIRMMIAVTLRRAGFDTRLAPDVEQAADLLRRSACDVILRDLNLAPVERVRSIQQLAATRPEFLRRTVIATTARETALDGAPLGAVFAVINKPFDLRELVDTVTACARRSREDRTPEPPVDVVDRFISDAPDLHRLLTSPPDSQRELFLRAQLRRTVRAISTTLCEAARIEPSAARAATFRTASNVAAHLADGNDRHALSRRNH